MTGRSAAEIDAEKLAFYLELLVDTHSWRERLVNELRFGDRNRVRSMSSYQIDFPLALLEKFPNLQAVEKAIVLVPLTTKEKRPLLNLGVSGPGGSPATVIPRASVAYLQTQHVVALVAGSPIANQLRPLVEERLLEALSAFSPSYFASIFAVSPDEDPAPGVARYLSSALDFEVPVSAVNRWRSETTVAGEKLLRWLQEPPDRFSSSEEMLLAIPNMSPPPKSIEEIDVVVRRFCSLVELGDRRDEEDLLTVIGEYGRRYELIVEAEVPLRHASRIKVEEDLPLEIQRRKTQYWVEQSFPLGDARSAHFEARVDDANVEIVANEVRDQGGHDASGWIEAVRRTREALALYSSERDRPYYVRIGIRLRVAGETMVAARVLSLANIVAIALAIFVGIDGGLTTGLAVLAIPTTIAAAFVLAREQTALATRLQAMPRFALAATAIALWLIVCVQVVIAEENEETSPARGERPTRSSKSPSTEQTSDWHGPRNGGRKWRKTEQKEMAASAR